MPAPAPPAVGAPPAASPAPYTPPPAGDAPPWASGGGGGMQATDPNRPALGGSGGTDFASTALDRPAFDFDAKAPPTDQGGWGGAPPAAGAAPSAVGGPPPAARPAKPVPPSDTGLKIALVAVVGLIVLLCAALAIGVVMSLGDDTTDDETEQVDED